MGLKKLSNEFWPGILHADREGSVSAKKTTVGRKSPSRKDGSGLLKFFKKGTFLKNYFYVVTRVSK